MPSPEGPKPEIDDVAGLLAAERPAAAAQLVEHVAVADGGRRDLDPGLAHRGVEAVVGHHRDRDAAAGQPVAGVQVERGQRDQLVAVDDLAVAVDRQHAVAVAVERERQLVAARAPALGAPRRDAVEPQPSLMLRPSGSSAITSTSAPSRRKISGAARKVAPLAQSSRTRRPLRSSSAKRVVQRPQVVLERAVQRPHPPDPLRRRRRLLQRGLDLVLGVVVELEPVGGEQLDPVVLVGIVRGRDDGRQRQPVAAHQQRRRRRRQHARQQRVAAGGGDPGGDRRLEHLAGLARVADDQHLGRP